MKSIRWSLLLYILILLGAAFGAISTFVYENTRQVLDKQQAAEEEQIRARYDRKAQTEQENLNRELLSRAQALASQAQFQVNFREVQLRWQLLVQLSLLARGMRPENPWEYLGMMQEVVKNPMAELARNPMPGGNPLAGGTPGGPPRPNLAEIWFTDHVQDEPHHFFQINANFDNAMWRSASLENLCLPVNQEVFKKGDVVSPDVGEPDKELVELPADGVPPATAERAEHKGPRVHWVGLKVPVASGQVRPVPRMGPVTNPGGGGRPGGNGPGPRRFRQPDFVWRVGPERSDHSWLFYIQYATDSPETNRRIADLFQDRDEAIQNLNQESQARLASLRDRLLLISLATFAATVAGGCWLVGRGLKPLSRLSDAVSRVSERDFQLPFQEPRLPSELRPIVERLQGTLELLKQAFEREKQAAADISHDLRTPVAALLTTTEVALRKPRSVEEYREVIQDCRTTGQQMSQIVERLLALARLDAGVDRLRPREVDVAEVAEQCAGLVRPLAEARDLTLHVHHEGPMPLVTDPEKFREVLSNLLHNAIEYNRPRGSVEVNLARQNGHLRLEVRDTGIGIAPQARERIFERFFRADPSRQADGQHSGLGLAIVKGYLDLMGGSIQVESAEGEGSTFRVELPVA